jgi:hypothetical protein
MFFMRKTLENIGNSNGFVKDTYPFCRVPNLRDMNKNKMRYMLTKNSPHT